MSDIARAQAEYDRMEPPDGSQDRCNRCGEKSEDHVYGDGKWGATWQSNRGVCPDEATAILDSIRQNEFEEIDEDEAREEAQLRKWEADREEGLR